MTLKNKIKKVIILGAGGRDFHNFNVYFRDNPDYRVAAFTAAQIPNIEKRSYPHILAGKLYPRGIPIFSEKLLPELVKKYGVDEIILAYSDLSHLDVMHKASLALSSGCDFKLLGPKATMLKSKKPIIAVCAVRTGCGKSQVTLEVAHILAQNGKKVAIVRHPMPYGDLARQIAQRFGKLEDLDRADCTIEEREEYEPIINAGFVVFAGVDYQKILNLAEQEADVIIWDGGNNDFSFFEPIFNIVVADAVRPGHEMLYYPGETNFRMADLIIINKVSVAKKKDIKTILSNIKLFNPQTKIILSRGEIYVANPGLIRNKNVLVVEDGPTVTHGGMPYGVGYRAAKRFGAKKILKPGAWARGEIKEAFKRYPHLEYVLPALGYGKKQLKELQTTIKRTPCDIIVSGTPTDLSRIVKTERPIVQAGYRVSDIKKPLLKIFRARKII